MQYYEAIIVIGTELPGAISTKHDQGNKFFLFDGPEISLKNKYSRKCLNIPDILGNLYEPKRPNKCLLYIEY
jgi:hypothetical protein